MLVNLKTALAARKLRQADLAQSLKITPSVLSEIVNGRRRPNPELRSRIAIELRADESWLFETFTVIPTPRNSEVVPAMACAGRE